MVIRGFLGYVANQLSDLNLLGEVPFEAPKQHFALTGLETIGSGGNRTDIVRHGEQDELLVDEVGYWKSVDVVIKESPRLPAVSV